MKRTYLSLFALLLGCLLLCSSCGTQTADKEDGQWDSKRVYVLQGTASEEGYYFLKNQSILCYFDVASKKSAILCSKQGCAHEDESCYAYIDPAFGLYWGAGMFCYRDHLYLLENQDGSPALARRNLDGSNYEKVLTLLADQKAKEGQTVSIVDYKVSGGFLFYQAELQQSDEEGVIRSQTLFRRVDLDTMQDETFYAPEEGKSGMLVSANGRQAILLVWKGQEKFATLEDFNTGKYDSREYLSSDQMQALLWDSESGSLTTLMEDNRWNLLGTLAAYEDSLYLITWDETHTNNGILRLDMKTGERTEMLPPQYPISNSVVIDSEHVMIKNETNNKWGLFSLKDFSETSLDFLPDKADLAQSVKDGYIVTRPQLNEDGSIQSIIYSYLTEADLQAGNPNFTDFYVEQYN